MLMAPCGLNIGVNPILIDHATCVIRMRVIIICESLLDIFFTILVSHILEEALAIQKRTIGKVLQSSSAGIVDRYLAFITFLGCDKYHTITSLGTVDGS